MTTSAAVINVAVRFVDMPARVNCRGEAPRNDNNSWLASGKIRD